MNVNTGEFEALTAKVKEQKTDLKWLVHALVAIGVHMQDAPPKESTPARPDLRVIKGGKR